MTDFSLRVLFFVLGAVSLAAVIATVCDKIWAIRHQWRVPEKWLLILSALGGSAAMYITMLLIRHKTRHIKFMLGIPIIMLFQAVVLVYHFRDLYPLP